MSMQGNANNASNASSSFGGISEPSRQVEPAGGDSMDVDMDVDKSETPAPNTSIYNIVIIRGGKSRYIEFPDGYEEEEAEMSADEDDDDEEAEDIEGGRSTEISAAVLFEKPRDEADDDTEDGDYVPNE